jgi:hypothetical protein
MSTQTLERPIVHRRVSGHASAFVRILSEYREMPGLTLTERQAARLLGLDLDTCRTVLTALVERRVLRRTTTGAYVRASS